MKKIAKWFGQEEVIPKLVIFVCLIGMAIGIFTLGCNGKYDRISVYKVAVVYFDGSKDTIGIKAYSPERIYLGDKGCIETTVSVQACGVRSFEVIQ